MNVLQLIFKSNNSCLSTLTFNLKSLLNEFAGIKKVSAKLYSVPKKDD